MLLEALRHALIRCPPWLKRLGVLHGLIAMEARYHRCRAAWSGHLDASRKAILSLSASAQGAELCVILGSGLLLDVPVDELVRRFRRVVLVDLFHMPSVRRRVSGLSQVELVEHDITGLLHAIEAAAEAGNLPPPAASLPAGTDGADCVISANCLSQLPLIPLAVAEASGAFGPEDQQRFAGAIVEDHLALLQELRGCRVIVSDVERVETDRRSGLADRTDLLYGARLGGLGPATEWWWDIAPAPEVSRRLDVRHRVVAGRLQ